MGIIFKTEKRRMIPKWRSIETASSTGELNTVANKIIPIQFDVTLLKAQKQAYTASKNLAHAGDLLSSAHVLGLENDFTDVAKFILENETDEKSALMSLAKGILKIPIDVPPISNTNFEEEIKTQIKYKFDINRYRSYLNNEPRNPIAWIELGRLYSLIGKIKKAKRCIDAALFLDSNNRFIVRSASRFYHHYHL